MGTASITNHRTDKKRSMFALIRVHIILGIGSTAITCFGGVVQGSHPLELEYTSSFDHIISNGTIGTPNPLPY
ncbi:hypothetical protein JCGZ_04928 [Jatropha curcas]|uniref:Uncharacterized protein n=1 Tax=Jatropha curcas TaxID=180498 RepID=A0A067L6S4_JATCU|nr:hypothetical protein JCGZ_04928 [Jatropha curcas]